MSSGYLKKKRSGRISLILLIALVSATSIAQNGNLTLNKEVMYRFEEAVAKVDANFHSNVKPFLESEINRFVEVDSVMDDMAIAIGKRKFSVGKAKPGQKAIGGEIEISPLLYGTFGFENADTISRSRSTSALGLSMNGRIGRKWHLDVNYLTANRSLPQYLIDIYDTLSVVPGEGYAFGSKSGYHNKNLWGYLSFTPNDIFNFQVGQGKNFWGDGYRSLLLSDVANNYGYFKITTSLWKIKYVNLFCNFKDIQGIEDGNWYRFRNKYGSLHYLSWNVTRRVNFSIFEAVMWMGRDTLSNRGFDVNYLNPVIFFRPVEYSLGSADNSLLGASARIKVVDKFHLYGQLILDEFLLDSVKSSNGWWANKQGLQAGFKWWDPVKLDGLYLQGELNYVRPFTYSHNATGQNYGHFNQPLAHPRGANFLEAVGIGRYQHKRWSVQNKLILSKFGLDSSATISYGGDIYKNPQLRPSVSGNTLAQGVTTNLLHNELKFTYMLFPRSSLLLEARAVYRQSSSGVANSTGTYFFVGIRSAIFNRYHDL